MLKFQHSAVRVFHNVREERWQPAAQTAQPESRIEITPFQDTRYMVGARLACFLQRSRQITVQSGQDFGLLMRSVPDLCCQQGLEMQRSESTSKVDVERRGIYRNSSEQDQGRCQFHCRDNQLIGLRGSA